MCVRVSWLLLPTLSNNLVLGMAAVVCLPLPSAAHLCQREAMGQKKAKLLFVSPREDVYGQFIHFNDSSFPSSPIRIELFYPAPQTTALTLQRPSGAPVGV